MRLFLLDASYAQQTRLICATLRIGKVLTRDDFMEILTDYNHIIDYTSDADGALETFGAEAGYGIISAYQMLSWVEQNCASACPGENMRGGWSGHLLDISEEDRGDIFNS